MKYSLNELEEKKNQIQSIFNFKIPDYILDELVNKEEKCRDDNIKALINLAKMNGRLTEKQSKLLIDFLQL